MRYKKLDLNLLVALDALLEERNITRASTRLHLSQSAMSNALARLREYFEDDLLVQVGRTMALTPKAEVLQQAVHDVLLRIDTSIAAQPEFDCTQSDREFKISASDYSMLVLVPRMLTLAGAQGSRVRIHLTPQMHSPARALELGETDLLLIPKAFCSSEHPTQIIWTDDFVCVVWNGSRHVRETLDFDHYAAAGHVIMQPPGTPNLAFEAWFVQRYGLSRRVDVTTYSFAALPALVVGTELVATVHRRLAEQMARAFPVTLLPLPLPMPPFEQAMQWHKYRVSDPGLTWLRKLAVDAAAPGAG